MVDYKKLLEDGTAAISSADMSTFTPKLGSTIKRRKKPSKLLDLDEGFGKFVTSKEDGHSHYISVLEGEQESEGNGFAFFRTSPGQKNGHTHTIALSQKEINKIGDNRQFKKETSQDDGHTHTITFEPKPLEENNIMENTEKYKLYNEKEVVVFELFNEQDYYHFTQGYTKSNPRYWRQNETTSVLLKTLSENRGKSFTVRYLGHDAINIQNHF